MRRSASEIINNLETRIARLEKSAGGVLPKKAVAELEDLLSDYPLNDNDMDYYWFTYKAHRVKVLDYMDEMSHSTENFNVVKYAVEATITLNELIHPSATIEDPRAKLYHLVDVALEDTNFRDITVLKSKDIEVKRIGTPKLITNPRISSKLEIPVKLVLLASYVDDRLR